MISIGAFRSVGAMIAGGFCVALSTAAFAYTPEQQQACSGDAMRLCGEFVPDVDRITMCMEQKKAQLTPVCRAQFGPPPRVMMRPERDGRGRPINLKPRKPHKRHHH